MFIASPNASCNTMRRSKQLTFDPGKMAVMVRSGSATHPSNCTLLWCPKYPHSTRKISLGKLKCVAQAHTTGRLSRPNTFAKSSTRATAPKSSSPARYLNLSISIRISQTVRCAASISAISGFPVHTILLLPFRHCRCPHSFPPASAQAQSASRS